VFISPTMPPPVLPGRPGLLHRLTAVSELMSPAAAASEWTSTV